MVLTLNHIYHLRMLTAKYESDKANKALIELTEKLSKRFTPVIMTVTKQLINGEEHAVTDRNSFTEAEMYEFLIDNKYLHKNDSGTCKDLWESQLILIEISKRMPVKTRCEAYTETKAA